MNLKVFVQSCFQIKFLQEKAKSGRDSKFFLRKTRIEEKITPIKSLFDSIYSVKTKRQIFQFLFFRSMVLTHKIFQKTDFESSVFLNNQILVSENFFQSDSESKTFLKSQILNRKIITLSFLKQNFCRVTF